VALLKVKRTRYPVPVPAYPASGKMAAAVENLQTCASIDMFVSGLGAYNSANARHSVAQLKDVHLFATKASWSTWQRLSIRSDKFQCLFWILKMSAACVGNFMEDYFGRPRRTHLRMDDEFNWTTVPLLVSHLLQNREQMLCVADGGMTPQRFVVVKAALEEAGWSSQRRAEMNAIRKKDEACYWLLCWLRGSVFRKFSSERMAVVGEERLQRYALRTAVKFVSTVMRNHTPLYYSSGRSWITSVEEDEGGEDGGDSDEYSESSSDYSSEEEDR
jgi:hypothetical protein